MAAPSRGKRLLRWISALALLALMGIGGHLLLRWEPQQLPVRVVTVDGKLEHLSPQRLQATVIEHLSGGILTQNLAELKAAIEAIPWVRSASLRRHWPDRLELAVEEQVAVARWGEDALVCADGVVFHPKDKGSPRGLPMLSGREENAPALVERLLRLAPLLQALDLKVDVLTQDARGAWTLRTSAGFTLALGTSQLEERINRFVRTYPVLAATSMPSLVDMRYSNGLVVRWAESGDSGPGPRTGTAARSAQLKSRLSGPPRS